MVLGREEHEGLLNRLNDKEITHDERTDILQKIRTDYVGVLEEREELHETRDKLKADNDDLILSNSKLFRQLGITGDDTLEEKEEEKNFSETITISEIENKQEEVL